MRMTSLFYYCHLIYGIPVHLPSCGCLYFLWSCRIIISYKIRTQNPWIHIVSKTIICGVFYIVFKSLFAYFYISMKKSLSCLFSTSVFPLSFFEFHRLSDADKF